MFKFIGFLAWSALFLIQCCNNFELNDEIFDRGALYRSVSQSYEAFVEISLASAQDFLQSTAVELSTRPSLPPDMAQLYRKIEELLTRIRSSDSVQQESELQPTVPVILASVLQFVTHYSTRPDQTIYQLLTHHGLQLFMDELDKQGNFFIQNFNQDIEYYIDNFPEAQLEKEHDIIEWYVNYKSFEDNPYDMAYDFIEKFGIDKLNWVPFEIDEKL